MGSSDSQRVVVTGVGLASPLGPGRESTWRNLLSGLSGIDGDAARVPLPEDEFPRAVQLAVKGAAEALRDSRREVVSLGERWGCVVSSSKPLIEQKEASAEPRRFAPIDGSGTDDPPIPSPRDNFRIWPAEEVPHQAARAFGVRGPVMNVASACATGLQAVMVGAEWIREGRCDAVLAGSSESSLSPLYLSGFSQLGVLSRQGKVRPFDRARDGFIVGEGAAVFVLESLAAARHGDAPIYGELKGWDFSCDASHATRFNSDGRKIAESLSRSLRRAEVPASAVGYVNAHGTATPLNDPLEARALRLVFQGRRSLRVSSTKGATGHLLGATGSVELAFCLLALRDRRLPPTLNLTEPLTDEIDFVAGVSQTRDLDVAAALSLGFGGPLATLVVGRV